jgi:hypothetical protein
MNVVCKFKDNPSSAFYILDANSCVLNKNPIDGDVCQNATALAQKPLYLAKACKIIQADTTQK